MEGTGVGQVDGAKPVDSQLEEMIDASVEYSGADKAIPHVETSSKEPTNETGEGEELATLSIPPTLADANGDHQPMDEVPPTSVPPTQHVEESPGGPGPKGDTPNQHVEGIPVPEVGTPVPSPSLCAETPAKGMEPPAEPPVATPCRGGAKPILSPPGSVGEDSKEALGVISPATTASSQDPFRPVPGELRLSQNAINLRMHRATKIDARGNCKVGDEIRKQFHTKKGKLRLQQIFQSCGYNVDRWDVLGFGKEISMGVLAQITMLIVIMNPKANGFIDT